MFESASSDDSRPADALGLAGLEGMAPGPDLAAVIHRIDPSSVTDGYDLVEIAAACRRLKAWADAVELRRRPHSPGIRSATRPKQPGTVSPPLVQLANYWPPASELPRPRRATA